MFALLGFLHRRIEILTLVRGRGRRGIEHELYHWAGMAQHQTAGGRIHVDRGDENSAHDVRFHQPALLDERSGGTRGRRGI